MAHHYYFPPEWIELQKEVSYHEEAILKVMSAADFVAANPFTREMQATDWVTTFLTKIAAVAAYCDVVLDGYYDERQITRLCVILTERLREKRKEWRVGHDE